MRRGAVAYQSGEGEEELAVSADAAKAAADRAAAAIDDALDFTRPAQRIAAMEARRQIEVSQGA